TGDLLSFEVALDLSYLIREDYSPTPSQTGKADMSWDKGHSGDYTDAYVANVGAVPVPGTLLLLGPGLVGIFGLRKKLRK
ncbi:MAG: PEP-CTERM sorting domain-containing protein, partial [Deltaproteobacteria bacterium]|nr:PEP-CTERM sorting domain-containing protein [Deltaproteobacteria bacterium]